MVIGHRLGLYRALAQGPATPAQLAGRAGCAPRYLAEWLCGQAAGGYVSYDPTEATFSLSEEQAFALTDPEGPLYLPGAFVLGLGTLRAEPQITEAFRTGAGMGWHEHDEDVFTGCELFFRPGYLANLVSSWIPALDGVEAKLAAGAKVADIGCGLGATSVILARSYPRATIVASDYHDRSIELARKRAAEAGVADRIHFEVAAAQTFTGTGYALAATFDCLHDMGDPVGAARHIHDALAPDGTWLVVEPAAGDTVEDNLNPVGRMYYSASSFLCVPNAISQPGGYALGAQPGGDRPGHDRRRIHPLPPGGTDPVQPDLRGSPVGAGPGAEGEAATAATAPIPTPPLPPSTRSLSDDGPSPTTSSAPRRGWPATRPATSPQRSSRSTADSPSATRRPGKHR